jgi:hypothetical protein
LAAARRTTMPPGFDEMADAGQTLDDVSARRSSSHCAAARIGDALNDTIF